MISSWEKTDNVLGTDFDLYSTYDDVVSDTNKWKYCDYNIGSGSFGHCGPEKKTYWNWYANAKHHLASHSGFKSNDKDLKWSILDTPTGF
jgi:hypothetical protein